MKILALTGRFLRLKGLPLLEHRSTRRLRKRKAASCVLDSRYGNRSRYPALGN
jgi:hypothetical protein